MEHGLPAGRVTKDGAGKARKGKKTYWVSMISPRWVLSSGVTVIREHVEGTRLKAGRCIWAAATV